MNEMKMSDDTLIKSPTKKKKRGNTNGVQTNFNQKVMNSDDEEEEKKGFTVNSSKKSKLGKFK